MVRKRSRGAKKHFDSEDEPDTESDFEEDIVSEPETKKYSLRQRKRPTFNSDDYEYDEDLIEVPPHKAPSDDDDFEFQNKQEEKETADEKTDKTLDETLNTTENNTEAVHETVETDAQDELVDFEDMIRADIVVNKNRIDYDNVIQKTEIKIQPMPEVEKPEIKKRQKPSLPKPQLAKPKGRRGRKPKRKNNDLDLDEPQFLAPQIQENESDEDYHPYKPKRTRKPKARPAGEIDSSILEDVDDYDFEDYNDVDYNPNDDLDYPGLSGLSNFILDKQISVELEDDFHSTPTLAKGSDNSSSTIDGCASSIVDSTALETAPDTTASINAIDNVSQGGESVNTTELLLSKIVGESDTNENGSIADTTSADTSTAAIPDTTETAQTENSTNNSTIDKIDDIDDGVPKQLNEKSGAFEKVTSTSYASVIRVNETIVNNSDYYMNGSVKHIENPEVNIIDCKEEIEEEDDDDDIVFIEDERKCEVIVLDD